MGGGPLTQAGGGDRAVSCFPDTVTALTDVTPAVTASGAPRAQLCAARVCFTVSFVLVSAYHVQIDGSALGGQRCRYSW